MTPPCDEFEQRMMALKLAPGGVGIFDQADRIINQLGT